MTINKLSKNLSKSIYCRAQLICDDNPSVRGILGALMHNKSSVLLEEISKGLLALSSTTLQKKGLTIN